MEYQRIINLLDDTKNEPSKFKTSMIRSNLSDYRDAYIHVKGTIQVTKTAAQGAAANN